MYRCALCGNSTDKDGAVLGHLYLEDCTKEELDNASFLHGDCCKARETDEERYRAMMEEASADG